MIQARSTIYWRIWFLLVLIYFSGILFNIPIIRAIPFIPYFGTIFIATGIINIFEGIKFGDYVKKNHLKVWEEVTSLPFLGSGNYNSFKAWKFIQSKETYGDENLRIIRYEIKSLQLLLTITFFCLPVFSIFLVILYSNNIITTWPFRSIFE